ncbi:putative long-chain-fatty-acid--CoA ligase [Helianthus debilis subsp. tardiflorus]
MLGWREFVDGKVINFFDFLMVLLWILGMMMWWGPYLWKSYKAVYEEVLNAVAALRASGIGPVSY